MKEKRILEVFFPVSEMLIGPLIPVMLWLLPMIIVLAFLIGPEGQRHLFYDEDEIGGE